MLDRSLHGAGDLSADQYPAVAVPVWMKGRESGKGYTREDHQDLANQFVFRRTRRWARPENLASVIGEDELSAD